MDEHRSGKQSVRLRLRKSLVHRRPGHAAPSINYSQVPRQEIPGSPPCCTYTAVLLFWSFREQLKHATYLSLGNSSDPFAERSTDSSARADLYYRHTQLSPLVSVLGNLTQIF
ncbi:hypothetical protein RRG08_064617 [Elysia crispata]|uniref:Uncharacterized protein n=1 Tax=Elysia crispata TaxID=231223 RepID=A0AAE1B9K7_9GAST|nr:hypothetical protein RRG08_064617 [Elysia crispata]